MIFKNYNNRKKLFTLFFIKVFLKKLLQSFKTLGILLIVLKRTPRNDSSSKNFKKVVDDKVEW